MSRLEGNNINNPTNDQEDVMLEIMSLLNDVTPVPDDWKHIPLYNPRLQTYFPKSTSSYGTLIYLVGFPWS